MIEEFPPAPLSQEVFWLRLLVPLLLCLIIGYLAFDYVIADRPPELIPWLAVTIGLLLAFVCVSLRSSIVSYGVDEHAVIVRTRLGPARLMLGEVAAASAEPALIQRSWRKFGNGGLGGYTGLFGCPEERSYRCYVSNPKYCVLVRGENPFAVSPLDMAAFTEAINGRQIAG